MEVRVKCILIVLLVLWNATLLSQDNKNIELLGKLTFPYEGVVNDIWGYVDELNNEYAIVGLQTGVVVVDVSDPSNPTELYYAKGPSILWRDIKVWNDHAYITNEADSGLMIIDLTPLPQSTNLSFNYFAGSAYPFNSAHDLFIDQNGICYVMGADYGEGGAIILDLSQDPKAPIELGVYDDFYLHDGMVRNDTLWAGALSEGFVVVDVRDKTNPITLVKQTTPHFFSHNCWLSDDGNTLFHTDERSGAFITSYDVSDIYNISELDRVQSSPGGNVIPHNTFYKNNFLVTSYYTDGVLIHDVTKPDNMVEVGYYDTSPNYAGNGFNGCWGVYPWLPSGIIIASDQEEGLHVLAAQYVRGSYLQGSVTDKNTTASLNGVGVSILGSDIETNANLLGTYKMGIADAGNYTVVFSKHGYHSDTIRNVMLKAAETTILDVALTPIITVTLSGRVVDSLTSDPLSFAHVKIHTPLYTEYLVTDLEGNFTIEDFPEGKYNFTFGKWRHVTRCFTDVQIDETTVPLTISLEKGYYDDFSFDFGWSATGNATLGIWDRDVPIETKYFSTVSNPGEDVAFGCGSHAYVTGNGGGEYGEDDVDEGLTILTSPVFDATIYADPYVEFYAWYFNVLADTVNPLSILLTDRVDTVVLEEIDYVDSLTIAPSWVSYSIRIADYIISSDTMQFIVVARDTGNGGIVEAAIDGFRISSQSTLAVRQSIAEEPIKIYPNPFHSVSTIDLGNELSDQAVLVLVQDIAGKTVEVFENIDQSEISFGEGYDRGVYFVSVYRSNTNKHLVTRKMVKL